MFKEISINGKPCELMKAVRKPKYGTKTILTDSAWEYVSLYLKRKSTAGTSDALFYWKQAHNFYLASQSLPDSARPLTSYYCILNAAKALLRFNHISDDLLRNHGLSSVRDKNQKTDLKKAETVIKGAGVLMELGKYYGCPLQPQHYSLFDILYNIPCVHRAFCVTFSKPEIFIPISTPLFVKKDSSKEAWLKCSVNKRFFNNKTLKSIPNKFEHDLGVTDECILRCKKRFEWDIHEKDIKKRKEKLVKYHQKMRKNIYYVSGNTKLWYLKKIIEKGNPLSQVHSNVLIFAAFHWLSELVRYNPRLFQKYMESKQNWLLHEFIHQALDQFVDEISCEITGQDIMCTGYRK